MGFFDIGGTSSTPVTSSAVTDTVTRTDEAITFDSNDVIIMDDSNVVSFDTQEVASNLPNTAGELFQSPDINTSGISFDAPVSDVVSTTSDSSFLTTETTTTVSDALVSDVTLSDSPVSDIDFVTATLTSEAHEDVAPMDTLMDIKTEDVAPNLEEEIVDAESTLRKAIAELELNASKIQSKVDAAFQTEAALLEEKSNKEEAHKIAMDTLQKAAEEARKTALDIQKSGERTLELKKLFEAQLV